MTLNYILLAVFAALAVLGFLWRRGADRRYRADPTKLHRRYRGFATALIVIGLYVAVTRAIAIAFAPSEPVKESGFHFEIDLWAKHPISVFGIGISETVINSWYVMAALVVIAVILRFTVLRKLSDIPKTPQNILETIAEQILGYMNSTVHGLGEVMGSYIFAVAAMLVGCAALEAFGFRTPASDITFTFALSMLTFFIINWYGVKKKGVAGRLKSLAEPVAIVFPIKVVTEFAIPISLACRLFGNMLGGLVIMDLIYAALGYNAVGIPGVLGLFFNVFEPLLQAFIFVTLTLTFIREAVE
ncbi:MAG: F0F1 ATP synthase subunit A [Oscillospiraceae bacterium]|jgi:F-type H+-transporting ATPase subunit a|nr:F0F1 ATP synthase subunit A [Oscillospiraceae bacterium]